MLHCISKPKKRSSYMVTDYMYFNSVMFEGVYCDVMFEPKAGKEGYYEMVDTVATTCIW